MKIALVGNPNSGKTTIFNALTGLRQHVANYPGLTVEKKTGILKIDDKKIELTDLPGIYSLAAYSQDEVVAKNFILNEKPDFVINIVDASNLERSLYLTTQLLELKIPFILVLNMLDVAFKMGTSINIKKLSQSLGVTVLKTIGCKKKGIIELINVIKLPIKFENKKIPYNIDAGNEDISLDRYNYISSILNQSVKQNLNIQINTSDKIDAILTHRFFGFAISFFVLWCLFQLTFFISELPISWLESFFSWLHQFAKSNIPDGFLQSLIVSGIIDGLGGVLSFTPLIAFMFLGIAFIESSGYMARISFLFDRILRTFGMHGNSIIAFIVGGGITGGCAVPGIMATRTLKDSKERLATILTVPFMNCGAKLPVYALFIAAFFSAYKGTIMFIITILSWFFALIVALLLRKTILKGESSPFIMELSPYRIPTLTSLLIHTWERTWMYLKKAGTMLLIASIIMWFFMNFPVLKNTQQLENNFFEQQRLSYSIAGKVGRVIEPASNFLMGFDWQTNIALIAGLAAKEIVVSTLATIYSITHVDAENSSSLSEHIAKSPKWNPLKAFVIIVFVMLYIPCLATVAVIKKETNSWRWAAFSVLYTTTIATLVSTLIYQFGLFFKIGV